jgi:hypothetical protein
MSLDLSKLNVGDLAKNIGVTILDQTQGELSDLWKDMQAQDKAKIQECSTRIAELTFIGLSGKDVTEDISWVKFRLASIVHLEANRVREAFLKAVQNALGTTFKIILGAAGTVL